MADRVVAVPGRRRRRRRGRRRRVRRVVVRRVVRHRVLAADGAVVVDAPSRGGRHRVVHRLRVMLLAARAAVHGRRRAVRGRGSGGGAHVLERALDHRRCGWSAAVRHDGRVSRRYSEIDEEKKNQKKKYIKSKKNPFIPF